MASITHFTIQVSDTALTDLRKRLELTRLPQNELDQAGWDHGVPLGDIQRLLRYWTKDFDWRKKEAQLNSLPHFSTTIQCDGFEELNIHFIHARSSRTTAIPLLFLHGWPGCFLEISKALNDLTATSDNYPSFHVIAPSLPNYGFSSGSTKRGFAAAQYAETGHRLMLKLGYDKYVVQGGDWGYLLARAIAIRYPNHCMAHHVNASSTTPERLSEALNNSSTFDATEQRGLERSRWFQQSGSGYMMVQSTKPQTLGYSLSDSPVALLAWIYEKLHDWTDSYPWSDEEICTWISIYWFSLAGPAASVRIYYEVLHQDDPADSRVSLLDAAAFNANVPMGISHCPMDVMVLPKSLRSLQGKVVFERSYDHGGHFFAWENPKGLVQDLREMFGLDGGAYAVVPGCSGY